MPARVGVQGFLRRSEQVEQREAVVSREQLVVPLLEEKNGNRDLAGGAGEAGFGAGGRGAEPGRGPSLPRRTGSG